MTPSELAQALADKLMMEAIDRLTACNKIMPKKTPTFCAMIAADMLYSGGDEESANILLKAVEQIVLKQGMSHEKWHFLKSTLKMSEKEMTNIINESAADIIGKKCADGEVGMTMKEIAEHTIGKIKERINTTTEQHDAKYTGTNTPPDAPVNADTPPDEAILATDTTETTN